MIVMSGGGQVEIQIQDTIAREKRCCCRNALPTGNWKKTYYSFIAVVITVTKKEFMGVSHTQSSTGADGIKANWVNSSHGTISSNSVNSVASSCTQHRCTHNTHACTQHMHIHIYIHTSWLLKFSVKLWGSKNLIRLLEVLMLFMKQAFLLLFFFFFFSSSSSSTLVFQDLNIMPQQSITCFFLHLDLSIITFCENNNREFIESFRRLKVL